MYGIEGRLLIIGAATLVVDLLAARLLRKPPERPTPPGCRRAEGPSAPCP